MVLCFPILMKTTSQEHSEGIWYEFGMNVHTDSRLN